MRRLFYDIEVSPHYASIWRTGRKVSVHYKNIKRERAVVCIGYMWEWDKQATVISWDNKRCDKKMLKQFHKIISSADECVGHNIDRFDLPWVRTRCLYHRVPPIPPVKTCDTLQWSRKYFYFDNNRLDYICDLLGLGRKVKTEDDLWDLVCWDNDRSALKRMERYCGQDVELLPPFFKLLSEYGCPPKTHAGVLNGHEKWTCPRCASDRVLKWQRCVTAAGTEQQKMKCKDCHGYYRISATAAKQYEDRDAQKV